MIAFAAQGAPVRLPPLPAPPHDPMWLRLDARAGWRVAASEGIAANARCRTLELAPHPDALRRLTEPSGSFGGLVPPANVALAGDGSLYLLDREAGLLRRFDPCACAFEAVPCFGDSADEPRRLREARALAIHGHSLYVCDAGETGPQSPSAGSPRRRRGEGGRVSVWALPDLALRAVWRLPPAPPARPNAWRPVAVAADSRGHIWVADAGNGMLHRFDRAGRLRQSVAGLGVVRHLAIDCRDRLYAVIDGADEVQVIADGRLLEERVADPEALRAFFPPLPFHVAADGVLDLRALCEAAAASLTPRLPLPQGAERQARSESGERCGSRSSAGTDSAVDASGFFDLSGAAVPPPDPSSRARYVESGEYLSDRLDSHLYRCQWHRVVVEGELPAGTRVQVATYTAEAEQPTAHVRQLPDSAWSVLPSVSLTGGEWDGLIRSEPGRYLWLRLAFAGTGTATPRLRALRIEFPRISLRRYLPAVWGEEPRAADFADRFLAVFDTTIRQLERRLDHQAELYDPLSAPVERDPQTGTDFLSWLAAWIGIALDRHWPEQKRREYLKQAARGFALRGTQQGLHRQLLLYFGIQPETLCCPCDGPRARCTPRPAGCAPPERQACAWQPPPLILEHYRLRRWLFLGEGRLGDQAVLWGQRIVNRSQLSTRGAEDRGAQAGVTRLLTTPDPLRDPFHVYAHRFSVFVPAACARSPERRRSLENLVTAERPAHTAAQIVYVEPRFRIGFQSMIGLDSVVGCYPQGVTLGATPVGGASVLGGEVQARVGAGARIGTTAAVE